MGTLFLLLLFQLDASVWPVPPLHLPGAPWSPPHSDGNSSLWQDVHHFLLWCHLPLYHRTLADRDQDYWPRHSLLHWEVGNPDSSRALLQLLLILLLPLFVPDFCSAPKLAPGLEVC